MSIDLDKAIRAGCDADDSSRPCGWPHCQKGGFPCNVIPDAVPGALRSLAEPSAEVIEAMATSIMGERFRRGWNLPGDRRGKKATALDDEMARAAHAALFKHLLGAAQVEAA